MNDWSPYSYTATVVSIYDADTLTLNIDLGFKTTVKHRVRLYGIDAWEVRGPEKEHGKIARDWLREQIPPGTIVRIETIKDSTGKYGRYLAVVYKLDDRGGWRNLNQELVENGHAETRTY